MRTTLRVIQGRLAESEPTPNVGDRGRKPLADARVEGQVDLALSALDNGHLWPLTVRVRVPSVKQSGW